MFKRLLRTHSDRREPGRLVRGSDCFLGDWHIRGQDKADVPCSCHGVQANVNCMWVVWPSLVYLMVLWAPLLAEWSGSGARLTRRLGGWCWRRREPVRRGSLSSGSLDARKARGQRQRRVEGHVVDVPFFEVMKRDQQERVQETTAEQVVTATEVGASTVVESVNVCEDRPQGVEAPVFVSRDRIQRLAPRAACWLFRGPWRSLSSRWFLRTVSSSGPSRSSLISRLHRWPVWSG